MDRTALERRAYRILGNREDAEDAAQEALIKAWRAGCQASAYLSRAAINESITIIRRRRSRPQTFAMAQAEHDDSSSHLPADGPANWTHDRVERLTYNAWVLGHGYEVSLDIARTIMSLPEIPRRVAYLTWYEGFDVKLIATVLEVSPRSVRLGLTEACRALEELIVSII